MRMLELAATLTVLWLGCTDAESSPTNLCGTYSNLIEYNYNTHRCDDGEIVQRTTMGPPTPPLTPPAPRAVTSTDGPRTTSKPRWAPPIHSEPTGSKSPDMPRRCRSVVDPETFECREGEKLCGGLKCCGYDKTYHPGTQTCCKRMGKSIVYDQRPEKKNVCCPDTLEIFQRGKQTCLVGATNDPLWGKPRKLKKVNMCPKFAYRVESMKRNTYEGTDGDHTAVIRLLQIYPKPDSGTEYMTKPMTLDSFSPKRDIIPGKLMILSNHDQSHEHLFYFYADDELYRLPKKLRVKRLRKLGRRISKVLKKGCMKIKKDTSDRNRRRTPKNRKNRKN